MSAPCSHPNCYRHGKSPCEGIGCNGEELGRDRKIVENDEFGAFARRILRAYSRRVADRDIEGLAGLVALQTEIERAVVQAVADLHGDPYSWTEIGRVLGISRQAAQQKYGPKVAELTGGKR